ncbi:MAG TPA: hypothetical protein VJJ23_02230 [Candidatus Nanoarchaeia archaeon]|nr:hypothetical protein [Candidatus Nanoarchaeia archaeon]
MEDGYELNDTGYNSGKNAYAQYSNTSSVGGCKRHPGILPVPNCPHCNP